MSCNVVLDVDCIARDECVVVAVAVDAGVLVDVVVGIDDVEMVVGVFVVVVDAVVD